MMKLYTFCEMGYFVDYSSLQNKNEKNIHIFCGKHEVQSAICPNCKKPLLRYLMLDLSDDILEFPKTDLSSLSFFFCWTCNIAQSFFFYKTIDMGEIKILSYEKGGCSNDFPYIDYPLNFPESRALLKQIPNDIQNAISQVNSGKVDEYDFDKETRFFMRPKHQIGGEPYLVQGELTEEIICPECKQNMKLLASFGDDCNDTRGFTGNTYVQVLYFFCSTCSVLCAYQQCD